MWIVGEISKMFGISHTLKKWKPWKGFINIFKESDHKPLACGGFMAFQLWVIGTMNGYDNWFKTFGFDE